LNRTLLLGESTFLTVRRREQKKDNFMTLREIIKNNLLTEGAAEIAGQKAFNIKALNSYLEELKTKLKSNKNCLEDFKEQYPNLETFTKIAFGMYNKVLQNGYERNNSQKNFQRTIEPILINFYNSL
jgi:hypothetical protein